ncbi:MAG: hypothetical protein IT448_00355 [Phycisphaerales bacterium]|nr:hypothetical protein [Phycisphaerales bacterium]
MKKDVRNNLIFIVALLILSAPGLVIMIQRRLQKPTGDQTGILSPVKMDVPYVNPLPLGSQTHLTFPPLLRQWVATLAPDAPLQTAWISQHRSFELIHQSLDDQHQLQLQLLIWDQRVDLTRASFTLDGTAAQKMTMTEVDLPAPVQSQLRLLGYLTPPQRLPRIMLSFSPVPPDLAPELKLTTTRSHEPFIDRLQLPQDSHLRAMITPDPATTTHHAQ